MKLFQGKEEFLECLNLAFWRHFSVKGIQVKLLFRWIIIHSLSHTHTRLHLQFLTVDTHTTKQPLGLRAEDQLLGSHPLSWQSFLPCENSQSSATHSFLNIKVKFQGPPSTKYFSCLHINLASFWSHSFLQKLNLVALPPACCKLLGENLRSLTFCTCWTWHILGTHDSCRAVLKSDDFPIPSPDPSPSYLCTGETKSLEAWAA